MNVLVLGGCADMAVPLNRMLGDDAEVKSVTLADLNGEKAKTIAKNIIINRIVTYTNKMITLPTLNPAVFLFLP